MPGATTAHAESASRDDLDDLDDLFTYDVTMDDVFKDVGSKPYENDQSRTNPATTKNDLGIDEEIKIVKKRQPIPKLDEARILSPAGVPKLRKISKDLRFKGKGHEFSDVARLLNTYQLWLDDLYPRAKFADALVMIEKLGHKKTIQMMRRAWIDEGKPRRSEDEDLDEDYDPSLAVAEPSTGEIQAHDEAHEVGSEAHGDQAAGVQGGRGTAGSNEGSMDGPDDDELDALLAEEHDLQRQEHNEGPDDDDRNALLAEGQAINDSRRDTEGQTNSVPAEEPPPEEDDFADEMEAMAELDEPW